LLELFVPLLFDFKRDFGKSVARQVDQSNMLINRKEINELGASRCA
jgi:hypothetical protein